MDIRDRQRTKEIIDNTAKMADAFTRIADALERLADRKTEPKTEVSAQEYERWLFKEPKDEPQTERSE